METGFHFFAPDVWQLVWRYITSVLRSSSPCTARARPVTNLVKLTGKLRLLGLSRLDFRQTGVRLRELVGKRFRTHGFRQVDGHCRVPALAAQRPRQLSLSPTPSRNCRPTPHPPSTRPFPCYLASM